MTKLVDLGVISLSMSISFLLARLVTISFGFVLISFAASTKHFEVGNVYTYDYIVGLELSEPSLETETFSSIGGDGGRTGSTVGYKILSQVQVKSVWHSETRGSILEIQLIKPQLQIKSRKAPLPDGFRDHSSNLDSATLYPFFVHWKDGQIQSTFSVKNDDISLVNIKKGIANILQVQSKEGDMVENTPAGKCQVNYHIPDAFHIRKTISGRCDTSESEYPSRSHNNPVLGVKIESEINATITMTRDAGVVDEVDVLEVHLVRVKSKREVGARIQASQSFKLQGTSSSSNIYEASSVEAAIKEIAKAKGVQLVADHLATKHEKFPYCEGAHCKTFEMLSKSLSPDDLATTKMSSAFLQMVTKFRESKLKEIQPLLKPNTRTFPQILDVCAAAGTSEIHQAVIKVLNFHSEEEITFPERYLLGLTLSPTPAPEVLHDLFKLMKRTVPSSKLQESLILTVGALAHTISQRNQMSGLPQSRLVLEIEEYFVNSLTSCDGGSKGPCQQLYLRALKNLKSKSTMPILFEMLTTSDSKTSVVAMKAIHAMPDFFIDLKSRPILLKTIRQLGRKYDSSVRTLALDVILRSNPKKEELQEIVTFLLEKIVDKQHAEVSTFMWNRVHEMMDSNPVLRDYLEQIIHEENLKTYHHLSPRGLSTAFTRVFTSTPSGNSSFSNAIEMSGKILKRSLFDVYVRTNEDSLQLLSLGIFADGLASFASDSSGDDEASPSEEEEEATAGMELTLMGVQTRPLVFFVGKGELMGMVWSGAGSERTSAIQGNVLLQDEKQVIPLFNGLVADVNIQGGISFDLAGQVELSLWHRTAKSLVENKAGVVLTSIVRADTSFVRSHVDYTVATEAALHFTSDINFYQGVIMCLKLTQPEFIIRQNIHKTERIPGSKHKLRKAKYKITKIPGKTYALNKKNSELCGVMYKDEL